MIGAPTVAVRNGFTLVELLVALFVFGLLATAGVYLLSSSADGQAVLSERLAENNEIVRAAALLRADLSRAIDRPSRVESGAPLGAFVAGGSDGALFAISALSPEMGGEGTRSDIVRIGYAFIDGALVRSVQAMPDGSVEAVASPIASGFDAVDIRYRDAAGAWSDGWTATVESGLPRAVELTVLRDGIATRIVALVGSQVRPIPIEEDRDNEEESEQEEEEQ